MGQTVFPTLRVRKHAGILVVKSLRRHLAQAVNLVQTDLAGYCTSLIARDPILTVKGTSAFVAPKSWLIADQAAVLTEFMTPDSNSANPSVIDARMNQKVKGVVLGKVVSPEPEEAERGARLAALHEQEWNRVDGFTDGLPRVGT